MITPQNNSRPQAFSGFLEDKVLSRFDLSQEDFKTAWDYNMEAASHIHEIMAKALKGGVA